MDDKKYGSQRSRTPLQVVSKMCNADKVHLWDKQKTSDRVQNTVAALKVEL